MGWFIVVVGVVGASAWAADVILNGLARAGRFSLSVGTIVVSSAGAVAAGFLFHIITLAWVGELPPSNIVWPCVTWSLIVVSSLVVGSGRPVHFAVRAVPWLLLGGITMLGSITHPRNFFSAVALVLIGIAYGSGSGQAVRSVATEH